MYRIYIYIIGLLFLLHSCNENRTKPEKVTLNTWMVETQHRDTILQVDTIFDINYIHLERNLKVKKHLVDSLIDYAVLNENNYIDSLIIIVDTIFYEKYLGVIMEFAMISFSKGGYFVTTVYNKDLNILLKYYHGHGRSTLKETKILQNGKVVKIIDLFDFSCKLFDNKVIFPELPSPPPLPPLINY